MGGQMPEKKEKQICIGILAHVDAGKTTLSEAMLYRTGAIRKLGRVDHGTAFLDTNKIEKSRGITVFSKEARFTVSMADAAGRAEKAAQPQNACCQFTLVDTPGHGDFSAEMERALAVLDYAVLVVSGADGVQSHTLTLWQLLDAYGVPTFVFVNKMDQPGTDRQALLANLRETLGDGFVDMAYAKEEPGREELAMCSEEMLETYLAGNTPTTEMICHAVRSRQLFPVWYGSALKMEGIDALLSGLARYTIAPVYGEAFGARVYKITRDRQGVRQVHLKITGGCLKPRMLVEGTDRSGQPWAEKVDQIRLYAGDGFQPLQEAPAGTVCAATGLSQAWAGEGLGIEDDLLSPVLAPTMTCKVILPPEADPVISLQKFRQLEEEDPSLHLVWKEALQEIHVQVMGQLQLEILQRLIKDRFDMAVTFGESTILYKETIAAPVVGIGHFEPLRHYAEVHLLLEPGKPGSGLTIETACSEDKLARNWQRLIFTHLLERAHPGTLIGAEITDMRITLLTGRAHLKHTEGGDFRQATYRAVRQGLRKARETGNMILLEPYYRFRLVVPTENAGRALTDLQRLGAKGELSAAEGTADGRNSSTAVALQQMALIVGEGPVSTLSGYQREIAAYTKGRGRFFTTPIGYRPCHEQETVVTAAAYYPEQDLENPTGSVFCQHGAAVYVPWDAVDEAAQVEQTYSVTAETEKTTGAAGMQAKKRRTAAASEKELNEIFLRTYGKSKRDEALRRARISEGSRRGPRMDEAFPKLNWAGDAAKAQFFLVDGYNVIFAWEALAALAKENLDGAREALLEILANYQGFKDVEMIVIFDGYKVAGNPGTHQQYGNMQVVYTKEAETADRFIEKTVYEMGKKYRITVVTSDRPVQMAALGDGAARMSAREFYTEVMGTSEEIRQLLRKQVQAHNRPFAGKFD